MLRKEGLLVWIASLTGQGSLRGHHVHLCHVGDDLGIIHDRFLAILCIVRISYPAVNRHELPLLL